MADNNDIGDDRSRATFMGIPKDKLPRVGSIIDGEHYSVLCDACKLNNALKEESMKRNSCSQRGYIMGTRYQSVQFSNFDLCSSCHDLSGLTMPGLDFNGKDQLFTACRGKAPFKAIYDTSVSRVEKQKVLHVPTVVGDRTHPEFDTEASEGVVANTPTIHRPRYNCRQQHGLNLYIVSEDVQRQCDKCRQKMHHGQTGIGCLICDWDICKTCVLSTLH